MEKNKKIVVGNMKMNLTSKEISTYLKFVNKKITSRRVVICPTSIYVPYFVNQNYFVGLQNIYSEEKGAYTGEISPKQAYSMGISFVIVGHSERRTLFKESDTLIHNKVKAALENHLNVILCIGETEEERSLLKTDVVIKRQIKSALKGLDPAMISKVILAYEPIWSIGTGVIPKKKDIEKTIDYIKGLVFQEFLVEDIPVLYGGSVNEKNIEKLNTIPNVSGFLVGGASTDPEKFLKIIEVAVGR